MRQIRVDVRFFSTWETITDLGLFINIYLYLFAYCLIY